ncbi:MAG: GNAT family N-acetyltransferase [Streptomycetaceae bacterium]|nr:GNAT family N-acetyltransferase [Streptomycetaceae bacterium]
MSQWKRPETLSRIHDTQQFSCGDPALGQWLKQYALTNHRSGAARVFVATVDEDRVAGYYCLSTASASKGALPERVGKAMPEPVPLILLGRLAVDQEHQGGGLGAGLLRDAMQRALSIADNIGVRALITHAANDTAAKFYERFGFVPSPTDELHMVVMLKDVQAILQR